MRASQGSASLRSEPDSSAQRSAGVGRPLAIDLFTGLHGWAEGLIAAGWHVIGFDLVDMSKVVGDPLPPEHFQLVLQDVLTLHGRQFKDAELIVGSSPCTEYSYMAMPWTRAKAKAAAIRADESGEALRRLNMLFDAQFRIQREASEAAGRHIPMVVENVKGAQPWVGAAQANFGSYYLWGDLPALMPIAAPRKVAGFRFDGSGRSFQSAAVAEHIKSPVSASPRMWRDRVVPADHPLAHALHYPVRGQKTPGAPHIREGYAHTKHLTNPADAESVRGVKYERTAEDRRQHVGINRRAASAKIAKIPFTLAHWIGRAWLPMEAAA